VANAAAANAPVDTAANQLDPGQLQSPAPASRAKSSSSEGKDDAGDNSNAADTGAAAGAASQAQAAANPAQPVAAAVVVNASADTAPTPGNTAAAFPAIGDSAKGRARIAMPTAAEQNASPVQDTTPAAPAAAQTDSVGKAAPGLTEGDKKQTASGSNSPQQAQPQTTDETTSAPAQTDAPAAASANRAGVRAADVSTAPSSSTGASNAQGNATGTKANVDDVANFGFSASAVTTPSAAAASAPSGAAPTTAPVPIAGLGVAIAARVQAGSNQFDIRLDPPELGRIDVRLDVNRDGQVTTHMTADRADTLQLLQSQQPQLERALEQAGLKTADNGLQFTLRDQSFTGQNNGSGSQTSGAVQLVIPDPDLKPVAATQIYTRVGLGTGIDIRV